MRRTSVALVAALIVGLAGCSTVPDDMPDASSPASPSDPEVTPSAVSAVTLAPAPTSSVEGVSVELMDPDDEVPEFETPWADEFTEAYMNSTSDLQREVLEDGEITHGEARELEQDLTDCLTDQGFTDVTFHGAGGFGEHPPKDMSNQEHFAIVEACQESAWGTTDSDVYYLYFRVQRNPAHEDETDIMAACLVRQGLVHDGYSGEDYTDDAATDDFPFDASNRLFQACLLSPLAVDGTASATPSPST